MPEQQTKKEQLRQYYRTLRKERTAQEKQQLDLAMQERFCASACYRNSNVLLLYAATIAEPETEWILSQALQDEKIVGLSRMQLVRPSNRCRKQAAFVLSRGWHLTGQGIVWAMAAAIMTGFCSSIRS